MASLRELTVPVNGQLFLDLGAWSRALDDWAVKEKFSWRYKCRDTTRAVAVCPEEGCSWRCSASYVCDDQLWALVVTDSVHSCVARGQRKHASSSKKAWLDPVVSRHLQVTRKTTAHEIVDLLRVRFAEEISYERAQKCRLRLLDGDIGAQRHSFALLPQYKAHLEAECLGVHVDLVRDQHDRFQRVFVCPPHSRDTFRLSRRLVAVDGTFLKARFIQTLLLAVGIDANGENVPLAWAVVESENGDSWRWFLDHLKWSIPEFTTEPSTLVSDRDKGLIEAARTLGPRVVIAHCCRHLSENFSEKFGRGLLPAFWKVARAKTRAAYHGQLEELRVIKPGAASYLEAADPDTWAAALCRGRRYGHDTSNIVESLNKTLRFERELPIVELLDALWHRVMAQRADRKATASRAVASHQEPPLLVGLVAAGREWARTNMVQVSTPTEGRVIQPDGAVHLVDLTAGTCSCRRYQDNGVPCGHAIALILRLRGQVGAYLPPLLLSTTWQAQYELAMPPMDMSGLLVEPEDPCQPPTTRIPRGRPKKERVRQEDARRPRGRRAARDHGGLLPLGAVVARVPDLVRSRCSTCGEPGHNARSCRRSHE